MISIGRLSKLVGVHEQTLRKWERDGKIISHKTPGGQRRYDPDEVFKFIGKRDTGERKNYIYCRIYSNKQEPELRNQIKCMQQLFPNYEVISDISSGIHYERRGFERLLEQVMQGNVGSIAVSHNDRIGRFGRDLFQRIADFNGTKIITVNNEDEPPESEIAGDIIAIIASYTNKKGEIRKREESKDPDDSTSSERSDEKSVHEVDSSVQKNI